jgi:hypothetical protein
MKELHGSATAHVAAPIEECLALLQAVDRYPSWYPEVVKGAEVVERDADGAPAKARTTLHVSHGPLVRDFRLLLAVGVQRPGTVTLTRVPHGPSDQEAFEVTWRLADREGTRIELVLDANLSVPRLIPLGGIGDAMAQGFVAAAARALGASRS